MKILLFAIAFLTLLTGCTTHSPIPASAPLDTKGPNGQKISFGFYDISKGTSISDLVTSQPQNASAASISGPEPQRDRNLPEAISETKTASLPNDRMVVKNGSILLESTSPVETLREVARIAETKGGYVLNSEQTTTDVAAATLDSVEISIRIASERFEETMQEIRGSSQRLLAENVKGEDVTEEFLDLAARIKTQKALEQQYLDILKQATAITDILTVQNHLTNVRTEVERLEGRAKFLRDRTSYSTITVNIKTAQALSMHSAGFVTRFSNSLFRGLDAASSITLGVVTFVVGSLPIVIFIGLPSYFFWKRLRQKSSTAFSASEIAKDELGVE